MRLSILLLVSMFSMNCFAEQFKLQCNITIVQLIRFQGKVHSDEKKAVINVDVNIEPADKTIDIDNAFPLLITSSESYKNRLPPHITKYEVKDTSRENTIEITRRQVVDGDDRYDKVKIDRVTGYIYLTMKYPNGSASASGKCSKIEMKNKF